MPDRMASNSGSCWLSGDTNGGKPHSKMYRIIPAAHTSIWGIEANVTTSVQWRVFNQSNLSLPSIRIRSPSGSQAPHTWECHTPPATAHPPHTPGQSQPASASSLGHVRPVRPGINIKKTSIRKLYSFINRGYLS